MAWNMPSSQFIIQLVATITESITPGCKHILVPFLYPMSSALSSHLFTWQKNQISVIIQAFFFHRIIQESLAYTVPGNLGRGPYLVLGWMLTSFPLICLPEVAADCGYSGGQDGGEWTTPDLNSSVPLSLLGGITSTRVGRCTWMGFK